MRLVVLIALLFIPAFAHANEVVQAVGYILVMTGWGSWVGYALIIASSYYGSEQARRAAAQQREQQRQAYNNGLRDRTITRVATDAPYRYIYGRARVGSDIVAIFTSGDKDQYKHLVCVHAAHECDAIEEIYIAGKALGTLDGNGDVTSGDYSQTYTGSVGGNALTGPGGYETFTGTSYTLANANPVPASVRVMTATHTIDTGNWESSWSYTPVPFTLAGNMVTVATTGTYYVAYDYTTLVSHVRVTKHLGASTDTADATLMALFPTLWTGSAVLSGFCYTVIRLDLNQPEFQSGIPAIEVLVRGKKLYDVRTGTSAWSQNPALAVYDYLTSEMCGVPGDALNLSGTALAGAASSLTLPATADTTPDAYKGAIARIVSGTGAGQQRNITTSRQNLCKYSQSMLNAAYAVTQLHGTITTCASPDSYLSYNAFTYTEDATFTGRFLGTPAYAVVAGTQYVVAVDFQMGTGATRYGGLVFPAANFGANVIASFTLSGAGAAVWNGLGTNAGAGIISLGGGWYRCWITALCTVSGNAQTQLRISNSATNGAQIYQGDGASNINMGRLQVEVGSVPSEYIHTEASAAVGVATDAWLQTLISTADWTDPYWVHGTTNTSTNIADTSATAILSLYVTPSLTSIVGQPYVASLIVKKDAIPNTTRFPMLRFVLPDSGGSFSNNYADIRLDTSTGVSSTATGLLGSAVLNGSGIIDLGAEWLVWISITQNTSSNGTARVQIYPAVGTYTTGWTLNAATTGSIDCRLLRLELGTYPSLLPDATSAFQLVTQGDIPVADYITAANVCDELVTIGNTPNQPRYTINGTVTADQDQAKMLETLAQCMAGGIVKTTWSCWAGKYVGPVKALDQSDIVGALNIISGTPDADLYNGVKGQYIGAENSYVVTDFTPYQNPTYVTADGRELWTNLDFPFTDSAQRIRNLSRIFCEDQRNGFTLNGVFSLKTWALQVGQRVTFTSAFLGQSGKIYRLTDKKFGPDQAVELTLKEDASTIWDMADAIVVDQTPNTNLPNPFSVDVPGNVQMVESLYSTTGSAGVRSKAVLSWDAPADVTVIGYDLQYKRYTDGTWTTLSVQTGTSYTFNDLAPMAYDFRVRARNVLGAIGQWTDIKTFTVYGLTATPANVTGFSVAAMNGMAVASWDKSPDLDVRIGGKVDIRLCPLTTGATWEQAVMLQDFNGDATSGTLPLYTGTYYAKFEDSTGHYSDTPASFVATEAIVTGWTTVATSVQDPSFLGSKTNVAVISGVLKLDSVQTIGAQTSLMSTWGMIGSLGGIKPAGEYAFDATLDLGSKAARRFHANILSISYDVGDTIGLRGNVSTWPSISGGTVNDCDVTVLAQVSDDNITFGPWTPFMVADFNCRYAQFKAQLVSGLSTHNIQVSQMSVAVKTSP